LRDFTGLFEEIDEEKGGAGKGSKTVIQSYGLKGGNL